jgi:hypothetical protein
MSHNEGCIKVMLYIFYFIYSVGKHTTTLVTLRLAYGEEFIIAII